MFLSWPNLQHTFPLFYHLCYTCYLVKYFSQLIKLYSCYLFQNDELCNGFQFSQESGECTLLILSSFFLSSTNLVSKTKVFYNSNTTTARTIPIELAKKLKGFWSFAGMGHSLDLSGNKQNSWSGERDFLESFTPGYLRKVKTMYLSNRKIQVCLRLNKLIVK